MSINTPVKFRKLKVGVLRGGPSSEYDVSLKTGSNVLAALRDKHKVHDILIDKGGVWHIDGILRTPDRIFPHIDVVFNALHGEYGEDGHVQKLMDSFGIPYTGSKSLPSAVGMNKALSKKIFSDAGLRVARHLEISKEKYDEETLSNIMKNFPDLSIVKPTSAGSSIGVSFVKNKDDLEAALLKALEYSNSAMVEEYIHGREATCGVVEGTLKNDTYALHPVEIKNLSEEKDIWGYDSKYSDALHELICPGNFSEKEQEAIQNASVLAHKALGLRHYSRSDFIIADNGVYILETNTLPGLTSASLFPRALAAADCSFPDFLDHILMLAVNKS